MDKLRKAKRIIFNISVIISLLLSSVFSCFYSSEKTAFAEGENDIRPEYDLKISNRNYTYSGDTYGAFFNGNYIDFGALPIFTYRGAMMVRAKKLFEAIGCTYSQTDGRVILKKGNISINMSLDSDIAYVNEKKIIMDAPAILVTNRATDVAYACVPLEFCLNALGFEFSYDFYTKSYTIWEVDYTGSYERNLFLSKLSNTKSVGSTNVNIPANEIFSFPMASDYESILEDARMRQSGKSYLTEVSGYALDNSDAIVLFGIDAPDVSVFLDGNMLLINLYGVGNLCGDRIYISETDENSYLNYCLVSGDMNTTRIITYVDPDSTYYVYDLNPDYVSIHITFPGNAARDNGYRLSEQSKQSQVQITPAITKAPVGEGSYENFEDTLPDDRLLIPLPQGIELSEIKDTDNYLNYNFVIKIPGNCVDYIKEKGINNPYSMVEGYVLKYNENTGYTDVSFDTRLIVAYTYETAQNHLILRVARPNEIYDKIVLLDPGHGGYDPGASAHGTTEKELNFKITNKFCKDIFDKTDIKVYLTRTTDVLISLEDRAVFADDVCADFFISLHMNSNNSSQPNGCEVYYSKANNKLQSTGIMSQDIAEKLVNNLSAELGLRNRGITSSDFYVVKYNKVPAVLIELGFMSNESDYNKLVNETYQKKAAQVIYDTCKQLFNEFPAKR